MKAAHASKGNLPAPFVMSTPSVPSPTGPVQHYPKRPRSETGAVRSPSPPPPRPHITRRHSMSPTPETSTTTRSDEDDFAAATSSDEEDVHMPAPKRRRLSPSRACVEELEGMGGHHTRCAISEEARPERSLQWAHVISPHRMKLCEEFDYYKLIRQLSFAWGYDIRDGDFWQPHTANNTMRLLSNWHRSFEEGYWALLPEEKLLDEIYSYMLDRYFSEEYQETRSWPEYTSVIPDGTRKFSFVPRDLESENPRIVRPKSGATQTLDDGDHRCDIFHEPFANLEITSHIHPYLAICDVMLKFPSHAGFVHIPRAYWKQFSTAHQIWELWTTMEIPAHCDPASSILSTPQVSRACSPCDSVVSSTSSSSPCSESTTSSTTSLPATSSPRSRLKRTMSEELQDRPSKRPRLCQTSLDLQAQSNVEDRASPTPSEASSDSDSEEDMPDDWSRSSSPLLQPGQDHCTGAFWTVCNAGLNESLLAIPSSGGFWRSWGWPHHMWMWLGA